MILKSRHTKNIPYTEDEINRYCDSVEKLLLKIKEDSLAKKRRKTRAVEVEKEIEVEDEVEVELEREHLTEDEDNLVLS